MAGGLRTDFEFTGVADFLSAIEGLQGKELERATRDAFKKVATRVAVPEVKSRIPSGPPPHKSAAKGGRGAKGPLNKSVTARTGKPRRDETAAVTIGPRAWYKHFYIKGTAKHVIEAHDAAGASATTGQMRTINSLEAGRFQLDETKRRALAVSGRFYARVYHPGGKPHDVFTGLEQRIERPLQAAMTEELLKNIASAARRRRK